VRISGPVLTDLVLHLRFGKRAAPIRASRFLKSCYFFGGGRTPGERLQQDLSLEASPLPPHLDRVIDELRKQDEMIA
jgi:hypothetical protein